MKKDTFIRLWERFFNETPKISGDWFKCRCIMAPYTSDHKHDVDQTPALNIIVGNKTSWCKCWVCGKEKGEPLLTFLAEYAKRAGRPGVLAAFEEAEEAEAEAASIPDFIFGKNTGSATEDTDYTDTLKKLTGQPDAVFMTKKGIDQETSKLFGITSNETDFETQKELGSYSPGIIIPYLNPDGDKCVGLKYRPYHHTKGPKYWFVGKMSKTDKLYGDWLIPDDIDPNDIDDPEFRLYLCEGELDVMHFRREKRYAIAVAGSDLSEEQAEMIKSLTDVIFVVGDPDPAGVKFSRSARKTLEKVGVKAYLIFPEVNPRELTQEQIDRMSDIVIQADQMYQDW